MAKTPEQYAQIQRFQYVSSSPDLVCTGQVGGSFNYERRDQVYPPGQRLIPVANPHGGIDYQVNPNFRSPRKG